MTMKMGSFVAKDCSEIRRSGYITYYALTNYLNLFKFMYCLNTYKKMEATMPRMALENNSRMSLRIRSEDKALLMRAVAYEHTDLTDFVLRNIMDAAKAVIAQAEQAQLSGRDSLRVLDALENPPAPNVKLLAAAYALPVQP
jgi:uncharacterized protein (DUF1778 family)